MNWTGKVVLITGASSGIGEALALDLASRGAALGLFARRTDSLERVRAQCKEVGGRACSLTGDVTNAAHVTEAVRKLILEFGHIDILIANAGIGGNNNETRQLDPVAVKMVIDTNLLGAVNAVHAVLPSMIERGTGHLVGVSSLAGFRGLPRSAAYSASKAGMTAFFEGVRLDVAHKGIFVTVIHPGFIKTPLTSGRRNKMPFLMELDDAIPLFVRAIEKKKRFAAFPWQLATIARVGRFMPGWMYDRVAQRVTYRE